MDGLERLDDTVSDALLDDEAGDGSPAQMLPAPPAPEAEEPPAPIIIDLTPPAPAAE